MAQQVHAVVARLIEPVAGTDTARIAQCLGLDPTHYRSRMMRIVEENSSAKVDLRELFAKTHPSRVSRG